MESKLDRATARLQEYSRWQVTVLQNKYGYIALHTSTKTYFYLFIARSPTRLSAFRYEENGRVKKHVLVRSCPSVSKVQCVWKYKDWKYKDDQAICFGNTEWWDLLDAFVEGSYTDVVLVDSFPGGNHDNQ